MKHIKTAFIFLILLVFLFLTEIIASQEQQIEKSFKGITAVQLNTIGGDCIVKAEPGDDIKIRFVHTYSNVTFEPQFKKEGSILMLKESFSISNESGHSTWYLTVPENTAIKYSSISGNFSVTGIRNNVHGISVSGDVVAKECAGDLEFKSVSGDLDVMSLAGNITVRGVSSDLKLQELTGKIEVKSESGDVQGTKLDGRVVIKSPSGDIRLTDCSGTFDVKTASGEIQVANTRFIKPSSFKTASGNINITLAQSLTENLELNSASGNAVLNYNGNAISGYFEFQVAADKGKIEAPFPFEKEEECERWGKKYQIKSFKVELGTPQIFIRTSSGTATLKKN